MSDPIRLPPHDWDFSGIEDTPVNREWLDSLAIPKCNDWRHNNPEDRPAECGDPRHGYLGAHQHPAPYCCSAYCPRCAGFRALDGEPPLRPNEWMYQDDSRTDSDAG